MLSPKNNSITDTKNMKIDLMNVKTFEPKIKSYSLMETEAWPFQ